ncbi:hypothetical protein L1887_38712 [Cichorium endivia]|nr:hypothetical protein L1887_38712 [Cichorium endivia]
MTWKRIILFIIGIGGLGITLVTMDDDSQANKRSRSRHKGYSGSETYARCSRIYVRQHMVTLLKKEVIEEALSAGRTLLDISNKNIEEGMIDLHRQYKDNAIKFLKDWIKSFTHCSYDDLCVLHLRVITGHGEKGDKQPVLKDAVMEFFDKKKIKWSLENPVRFRFKLKHESCRFRFKLNPNPSKCMHNFMRKITCKRHSNGIIIKYFPKYYFIECKMFYI